LCFFQIYRWFFYRFSLNFSWLCDFWSLNFSFLCNNWLFFRLFWLWLRFNLNNFLSRRSLNNRFLLCLDYWCVWFLYFK
jgi:hypothetical protein